MDTSGLSAEYSGLHKEYYDELDNKLRPYEEGKQWDALISDFMKRVDRYWELKYITQEQMEEFDERLYQIDKKIFFYKEAKNKTITVKELLEELLENSEIYERINISGELGYEKTYKNVYKAMNDFGERLVDSWTNFPIPTELTINIKNKENDEKG